MQLPEDFQFSASSLQDFEDCRYRFFLRYVQQVAWPAVQSEPALESERRMLLGERFHQLAQSFFLGVPAEALSSQSMQHELAGWWSSFLENIVPALPPDPSHRYAEYRLSAQLQGRRLQAKLDLLCRFPDKSWRIFDWKTSPRRPARAWLKQRLQTRLYPYLVMRLLQAGEHSVVLSPEQLSMTYWYPALPEQPETFQYSASQYALDAEYFSGLMAVIDGLEPGEFFKTDRLEECRFCVYRSLCERGIQAGDASAYLDDVQAESGTMVDFDQVTEIVF